MLQIDFFFTILLIFGNLWRLLPQGWDCLSWPEASACATRPSSWSNSSLTWREQQEEEASTCISNEKCMIFPLFIFMTTGIRFMMTHPAGEGAAMESGCAVTIECVSYHIWGLLLWRRDLRCLQVNAAGCVPGGLTCFHSISLPALLRMTKLEFLYH